MSYSLAQDANQRLMVTGLAQPPAFPFSVAGWAKLASTGTLRKAFALGSEGSFDHMLSMGVTATGEAFARHRNTGNADAVSTTQVSGTGVWQHLCAVFTSDSSRSIYLNGGGGATNTVLRPINSNWDALVLGTDTDLNDDWHGSLAHFALWLSGLSASDAAALAAGSDPRNVQGATIARYWPLTYGTNPEPDEVGDLDLALIASPTYSSSDNPTIAAYQADLKRRSLLLGVG